MDDWLKRLIGQQPKDDDETNRLLGDPTPSRGRPLSISEAGELVRVQAMMSILQNALSCLNDSEREDRLMSYAIATSYADWVALKYEKLSPAMSNATRTSFAHAATESETHLRTLRALLEAKGDLPSKP